MDTLSGHFENLSPLLDDVVARIGELRLCPYRAATLSAWAMTRIAVGMRLSMAEAELGEQLTAQEREHLMEMIHDSLRKVDAAVRALAERYGATVQ